MASQIVGANERTFTVAMEDAVPPAQRLWAVMQARLVDELTDVPPKSKVRVETLQRGFTPRVAAGGLIGLLAIPETVFPHLNIQSYSIPFSVYADGFLPLHEEATFLTDVQFPEVFEPFRFAGDLALHRVPIMITGRVLRRTGGVLAPVAGATVEMTGLWPLLVPAAAEPPAEPATLVSLEPPLYVHRTAASGRLRRREVTPVVGEDKVLLAFTPTGDARLEVSDWINLGPGDLLLIDSDPAIQEYGTIDAIAPVGAADLPAIITLTHGLAYSHRPGRDVRRVVPQAPGPDRQLSRDAIAGDTCVFLNSLAGLSGVEVVEVFGGGAAAEFHRVQLFADVSDAEGRYRLPLLSRAAKVEIEAAEGITSSGPVEFVPDYLQRENLLDIELS